MNTPADKTAADETVDDKTLDAYLSGASQFSQQYRKIAADAVPNEIDNAVLAQMRRESIRSGSHSLQASKLQRWRAWSAPVALAASVVLVVAIVLESGVRPPMPAPETDRTAPSVSRQDEASKPLVNSMTAPASSFTAAKPTAPSPEEARRRSPSSRNALDKKSERAATSVVQAQRKEDFTAAAPATTAATSEATASSSSNASGPRPSAEIRQNRQAPAPAVVEEKVVVVTARARQEELFNVPIANTALQPADSKSNAAADAASAKATREADPAAWLAYIRQLRIANKSQDADQEWQRFVKAHPDFPVDANDSARAKQVEH